MSKRNEKDIVVFVAKENKKCFLIILFSAQKCIFYVQKFLSAFFSFLYNVLVSLAACGRLFVPTFF